MRGKTVMGVEKEGVLLLIHYHRLKCWNTANTTIMNMAMIMAEISMAMVMMITLLITTTILKTYVFQGR